MNRAVLFGDVSGSTRLYEKLGDARALKCIGLCMNIMRDVAIRHAGRVVKTIGDEVMCVFPGASEAAQAAIEMQSRIGLQDAVDGHRLAIRVGLQFGPVIEEADDVFGDSVNVAARMASLAKAGQIITTSESVEAMGPVLRESTRSLASLSVKGKQEEVAVCEIIWQQSEDMTALVTKLSGGRNSARMRLRLRHSGREVVLGPDREALILGRDASSDLVIADRKASRQHARIERRRDKYILQDLSSNGTFVTFHGQPELGLRREEVVLHGQGSISFGHPYSADPTEVVAFDVQV
ncbi:MAG: adenylate/guanylate cyclase domain-containing protein [Burkholderiales bacterium]